MRIESLSFSSVKGFDGRQTVPIRDLTLIYGPNSSGKSSIFQCILLLKQSVSRISSTDSGILEFRSGPADLGGFKTFVHRHDVRREIGIGLTLSETDESLPYFEDTLEFELKFGLRRANDAEPHLLEVLLRDTSEVRFRYASETGTMRLADTASATALVQKWAAIYEADASRRPSRYADLAAGDRRWLRDWVRKRDCELSGWIPTWSVADLNRGKQGRPFGGSLDSPRSRILGLFIQWWRTWAARFTIRFNELLRNVVYVGPLREFPRRVATEASEGTGVGVRGERLVLHLARNPELVTAVNEAFISMEIPYRLAVERVFSDPIQDALGDVAIAVLHDTQSGVVLSPADVGFGLSQVLPVVVQLLGNHQKTILVEQPEIHLHPKIQSRLTDILITAAVKNGNKLLVETHSEHLLLRAQRRLREASTEGFGSNSLGVLFVRTVEGVGAVQDLRIDNSGQLLDPWPDGFFDERFDDLFVGI